MLLGGERTAVLIEQATGTLVGLRIARIPGRSGLNRVARRSIVSARVSRFVLSLGSRLTQSETDI